MNLQRHYPYLILFASALIIGFLTGLRASDTFRRHAFEPVARWFNMSNYSTERPQTRETMNQGTPSYHPNRRVSNGQQNLLVIGIDRLSSTNPRLESLWLVITLPGSSTVTLMPLYPPIPGESLASLRAKSNSLFNKFRLSSSHEPDPRFFNPLLAAGFWWDGYIVLDKIALTELAQFVSMEGGDKRSFAPDLSNLSNVRKDPLSALKDQTHFVEQLCIGSRVLSPQVDFSSLFWLIPSHLETDLDPEQVLSDWRRRLASHGGIRCEFPYKSIFLPVP